MGSVRFHPPPAEGGVTAIVFVGIDLAKNVFAVHAVDEHGKPALVRPAVPRAKLHELIASLPPCTVATEACSGGHHWARLFAAHGHTVRLIAPKFVAPYRMSGACGKNDAADAAAICEAVQRPAMRFVSVKSIDQQALLMVHRARQGFVEGRTTCINRVRGLLSELGIVLPLKAATVRREAGQVLEGLPGWANTVVGDLMSELHRLDERIAHYDQRITAITPEDERARQLARLSGVGPFEIDGRAVMNRRTPHNAAMPANPPTPTRLRPLLAALEAGLLERSAAVRLALLAALAGEHVLLIGPPGTAKSELARRLHRAFDGARYFERLLTRFSTPEELFGPLSLKALEDDRYERLVDGWLPTASIAFLDEVFKANSAILNALLTLLNEREFDNGPARLRTPLISVIGASNEVPAEEALTAFYDRFLVRVPVAAVGDASFAALLRLAPQPAPPARPVTRDELAAALAQRDGVALGDDALAALHALRSFAAGQGIAVSDRRWRQIVGLLRSAALTDGRAAVDALDLWLVPYTVAALPAQVGLLHDWFVREVAQAAPQQAPWLTRAVEAFEKQLEIEASAPADEGDDAAGKLALARSVGGAGDAAMLRMVSATLEAQLRKRYSPVHVAARLAQIDEIAARANGHIEALRRHCEALAAALAGRLWLPPELAAALLDGPRSTLAALDALLARLAAARAGFAALPLDAHAADAAAPEPLALTA